jgi:hypothetical protein
VPAKPAMKRISLQLERQGRQSFDLGDNLGDEISADICVPINIAINIESVDIKNTH